MRDATPGIDEEGSSLCMGSFVSERVSTQRREGSEYAFNERNTQTWPLTVLSKKMLPPELVPFGVKRVPLRKNGVQANEPM